MYLPAKCNGNPESDLKNVTARKKRALCLRDIYTPRYWRNLNLASIGPPWPKVNASCFCFLNFFVNSHDVFGLGGVLLKGGGRVSRDPCVYCYPFSPYTSITYIRLRLLHATLLIPRHVRSPAQSEARNLKKHISFSVGKRVWNR